VNVHGVGYRIRHSTLTSTACGFMQDKVVQQLNTIAIRTADNIDLLQLSIAEYTHQQ